MQQCGDASLEHHILNGFERAFILDRCGSEFSQELEQVVQTFKRFHFDLVQQIIQLLNSSHAHNGALSLQWGGHLNANEAFEDGGIGSTEYEGLVPKVLLAFVPLKYAFMDFGPGQQNIHGPQDPHYHLVVESELIGVESGDGHELSLQILQTLLSNACEYLGALAEQVGEVRLASDGGKTGLTQQ